MKTDATASGDVMENYVIGILLNKNKTNVLLIRKKHPEWQKGLLNAPGGHIESG